MRRYESNKNIDYDSVLSKKLNNDRIKELEKIYLPRLEVIKPKRKKKWMLYQMKSFIYSSYTYL